MNQKIEKLKERISEIQGLKITSPWGPEYQLWKNLTDRLVKDLFGTRGLKLFQQQNSVVLDDSAYIRELDGRRKILEGLVANEEEYRPEIENPQKKEDDSTSEHLFIGKQPDPIGYVAWLLGLPKRINQALKKYIKGSFLRMSLVSVLFLLIIFFLAKVYTYLFRDMGYFKYQPQEIAYGPKSTQQPVVIDVLFQGDVGNISSSRRYLRNFVGVLWKNESLGSTWSYIYSNDIGEVYSVQGNKDTPITLPLLFEPNETKTLKWHFEINASDDPEIMRFLSERTCIGVFCWNKNNFSILTADSRGNIFDEEGNLKSRDAIDSWWVFPNNQGLWEKTNAFIGLGFQILYWKLSALLPILK